MGGAGKAQLRYEHDTSLNTRMQWKTDVVTHVLFDADGDGTADARMSVVSVALNHTDFLL